VDGSGVVSNVVGRRTGKRAQPTPGAGGWGLLRAVLREQKAGLIAGMVVAGPHVRAACARHLRDLEQGMGRGLRWDREAVSRAIRFFAEGLCLAGGQFEGRPFVLHPSQAFIVGSIFGWKRPDGTRRFRRAYIEQGKGSGKSPLAAGVGMYCLLADGEPRAEVYAAASMKSQAMGGTV